MIIVDENLVRIMKSYFLDESVKDIAYLDDNSQILSEDTLKRIDYKVYDTKRMSDTLCLYLTRV